MRDIRLQFGESNSGITPLFRMFSAILHHVGCRLRVNDLQLPTQASWCIISKHNYLRARHRIKTCHLISEGFPRKVWQSKGRQNLHQDANLWTGNCQRTTQGYTNSWSSVTPDLSVWPLIIMKQRLRTIGILWSEQEIKEILQRTCTDLKNKCRKSVSFSVAFVACNKLLYSVHARNLRLYLELYLWYLIEYGWNFKEENCIFMRKMGKMLMRTKDKVKPAASPKINMYIYNIIGGTIVIFYGFVSMRSENKIIELFLYRRSSTIFSS